MTWVDVEYMRQMFNLDSSDITDDDVEFFLEQSQKEILMKINEEVQREPVEFLDNTRKNEINGVNKEFYISNWNGNYISDNNYDLLINTKDVEVFAVDSDSSETKLEVSSIDSKLGKYTLENAPTNVSLFTTYAFTFLNVTEADHDPRLEMVLGLLTASYCYLKIGEGQQTEVKFGNVKIKENHKDSSSYYYTKYLDLIGSLMTSSDGGALYGFNVNQI